jgi:antitoxin ParD1/3/4
MNIDNICYAFHDRGDRKENAMASGSIHVKVSGALQDHIQQQIGDDGLYENASEYIRALIRRDLQTRDEAWDSLRKKLDPAMRADDREFIAVSADDVIGRNKRL